MKISICMATYNGGKYIREQMKSILDQKFVDNSDVEMEIIVSDDGSSDDTLQIINEFNDERIKVYHHEYTKKHRHYKAMFACTENFANAMSKATGDYIFLSDQDDIWYPWKIDKTLTVLKEMGGVVGASFEVGNANMKKIGEVRYKIPSFFTLKYNHPLYGFSCGFSKEELKYFLPMPNVPCYDIFIMLVAIWNKKLYYMDEFCAMHRWTGTHNLTCDPNTSQNPLYVKLYYRVKTWIEVIYRCFIVNYKLNL